MSAPTTIRDYDIVILGATGYTASICAEYVVKNLPTNLKWAVAGRSESKLRVLVEKLKRMNEDRLPPSIEIVGLEQTSLDVLARKSRLILNGIGPYHLYSTPVVEACVKNGTHYVGFSLETPWVEELVTKYDRLAKENGAMVIPTIALAPSDLVAYLVAVKIQQQQPDSMGTAEVNSTAKLELQGMSGGSLSTVLNLMSTYGISWIFPGNPWSLTSKSPPTATRSSSILYSLFNSRNIQGLGHVTTSFLSICNESIVHRSASLLPGVYGHGYNFHEYAPVPNIFAAILVHLLTRIGAVLLSLRYFRWTLSKIVPSPGTGPDLSKAGMEKQTFCAIGSPAKAGGQKVKASFVYEGSLYGCSAFMGVEAASVILGNEITPAHVIRGGILTPALLGMPYVEKLRNAGVQLLVETL